MFGKRRIISSDRYCGRNPAGASRPVAADVFDYRFDDIGNRLSSSVASVSQTYTANALNQYLTVGANTLTYDADGNLTTQAVRATDFPWTRAINGSLTDRDDGFHKRNADGNLTSDGSRNFSWTADEAREREDGAPQACPKGWRDRASSRRSLQQNRLKKIEPPSMSTFASRRLLQQNHLKESGPVAPLATGAKKIEFTYDYLGQRQPKLYDQRAEPMPHRRGQDLDPRRRQQPHPRRRRQSRQRRQPQLHLDGWTERGSAEMAQALLASAGPNERAPLGRTFGNLVAVYNAASSNALLKTHTRGLDLSGSLQGAGGVGGLLGVKEHSGTHAGTCDFAYDANGNVSEVLKKNTSSLVAGAKTLTHDADSNLAAHYEYDPFGNTIRSTGTYAAANPFRFSTKYWDPETTLYYYGYRYYDPVTGRWPNRDPIRERGGLNLYAFVRNNAQAYIDDLGNSIVETTPGFGGGGSSIWDGITDEELDQIRDYLNTLETACDGYGPLTNSQCCDSNDGLIDDDYTSQAQSVCENFIELYGAGPATCVADCLIDAEESCQANNQNCSDRASCRLGAHVSCYVSCRFIPDVGLPPGGAEVGWENLLPGVIEDVLDFP